MKKILTSIIIILVLLPSIKGSSQDSYEAFARQDYYTTEEYGEIVVFVPGSKNDMLVTVDLAFEFEFLLRQHLAFPGHTLPVVFPLEKFHEGNNEVTVSFYENEMWIDSRKVNVVVKKPASQEVKVDRLTGTLVAEGLPFIPVGFYCSWPLYSSFLEEEAVRGFNLVSPYWKIDRKGRKERLLFMDRCAELGMKVNYNLCSVAGGGGNTTSRSEGLSRADKLELLRDEVEAIRNHPALLAWYISDEPVGQGVPADSLKTSYDLIKELDPYHPVTIVFMAPHMAEGYRNVMDIAMTDPYPIPSGWIREVERYVNELQEDFRYEKPVWLVPQAFGGNEWWTREPNPKEVRAMTYLGVVNGAAGIQYFIRRGLNGTPKSQSTWGECGRIAQELMELTPALTSGQPAPAVETFSLDIRAKAFNQDGMITVVVVNAFEDPVECKLEMKTLDLTMEGEVLFENRKIKIENGTINDIIDGLGTRIYRFDNRQKVDWVKDFHPKNMTVDPGFENNAIPAVPASCYVKPGEDRGASYWLDGRTTYQGDHAIRVVTPSTGKGVTLSFFGLELDQDRSYTCSIWGKAAFNELPKERKRGRGTKQMDHSFVMALGKMENEKESNGAVERYYLSEKWQKYSFTTAGRDVIPSLAKWYAPQIRMDGRGTAWFDELQVFPDLEIKNKKGEGGTGRSIELVSSHPGAQIHYTLDGSEPNQSSMPYIAPFPLESTATVRAASYKENVLCGALKKSFLIHKATSAPVHYQKSYERYTAGGDEGLVDGVLGSENYKDGKWQGFHGQDAEFYISLGKEEKVNTITLHFLQDIHVWIFLPLQVSISVSRDGLNYDKIVITSSKIPADRKGALIEAFTADFGGAPARFIRIEARSMGNCPPWHSGAGLPSWIFLDEVVVE